MKTFRRDRLLRLARAGKLRLVGSYHFDDMYGVSQAVEEEMAVKVQPADPDWWKTRERGVCYVRPDEFDGHGRAWLNENGTVTLIVHSNSNYTFRIAEE